jgi:hypothetical protein
MKLLVLALLSLCFMNSYGQTEVKLEQLKNHVGDTVKVKGKIYGARYLETAKNTPTLINVGGAYPNQLLTIVIWGYVKKEFDYDPGDKKNVGGIAVVTGKVELYKEKPQIVVNDPSQLRIFVDQEVPASQVPPVENND